MSLGMAAFPGRESRHVHQAARERAGSLTMTTVQITLPDALAHEATKAGLPAPMTPEEISAEIDAYRTEQRRAAGS